MTSEKEPDSDWAKLYKYPARSDTIVPALQFGAFSGATGTAAGAVSTLFLLPKTPALFSLVSGIQCFLLGTTFWFTRYTLLHAWTPPINAPPTSSELLHGAYPTARDRAQASGIAGGISGAAIAGLTRGRRNILPATVMWSVLGYVGQRTYNALDARHTERVVSAVEKANEPEKKEKGFWERVADMKWSPMRTLSDEEYADILREKMLGVDAEIALIDEEVEKLKGEQGVKREVDHANTNESPKK